jgi:hypothetical protein
MEIILKYFSDFTAHQLQQFEKLGRFIKNGMKK